MKKLSSIAALGVLLLPALLRGSLALAASPATQSHNAAASGNPQLFASSDEAVAALQTAVAATDMDTLRKIFGPQVDQIISGDKVQDANELANFAQKMKESCDPSKERDDKIVLNVGQQNWPFPIPLVKRGDGQWFFDTLAGKEEIVNRRVGENELNAIAICRAYVDAQREYATADRDGSEVLKYAQKIKSTQGKEDGLYWDAADGEDQSPFGPLVAAAHQEGYGSRPDKSAPQPYHGYFFKILKTQGNAAPGGAYNYVINGNMIAGFALIAWPDSFGQSGVMTFIVNQQGKVYEKPLGSHTPDITAYNPDKSWTLVEDEAHPDPGQ